MLLVLLGAVLEWTLLCTEICVCMFRVMNALVFMSISCKSIQCLSFFKNPESIPRFQFMFTYDINPFQENLSRVK